MAYQLMSARFYAEQDGDGPKGSLANSCYVVDRYANPMGDHRRTDCETMRDTRKLVKEFNADPPWDVYDNIQAERDNYDNR